MATFGQRCTIKATGDSNWIRLNVGGRTFVTTKTTLVSRDPDCMFASMFNQDSGWNCHVDETGAMLIDRSPEYFEPLLNYLRHGQLILNTNVNPRGVLEEAQFYGLKSVIDALNELIEKEVTGNGSDESRPISRRFFVEKLMLTPVSSKYTPEHFELRCQGLNFEGCDLSKLDLRYVNFKFANLRNVDFTNSNLSYCNFERAVLQGARLDGAKLYGVKMVCVNAEGASMKRCSFDDPEGSRANLEGAILKGVDLDSSQMAGLNLRVATLKNASVKNCDLRGAVLAGADLENCVLTGSDLQEANLRGTNLRNATLEEILYPLHMSQTLFN